ncbi:MAG: UvrD-helicase domain-containing protein [Clostridium sp.]|nr:MAG: UvrD-helicase domain-containing protein [Clostridium sp.]
MAFTKEQQQAINEDGKNIIVSAGAGSGKTQVFNSKNIASY